MHMKNAIISRLKIMAELDISERRLPQDGRLKVKFKGHEVDFRGLHVLPTLRREGCRAAAGQIPLCWT